MEKKEDFLTTHLNNILRESKKENGEFSIIKANIEEIFANKEDLHSYQPFDLVKDISIIREFIERCSLVSMRNFAELLGKELVKTHPSLQKNFFKIFISSAQYYLDNLQYSDSRNEKTIELVKKLLEL